MNWCCDACRDAFDSRYERGLFVYVELHGGRPQPGFCLASRSLLHEDVEKLRCLKPALSVPINITSRQAIFFCPWCGVLLAEFYEESYVSLVDPKIIQEFAPIGQCAPSEPS